LHSWITIIPKCYQAEGVRKQSKRYIWDPNQVSGRYTLRLLEASTRVQFQRGNILYLYDSQQLFGKAKQKEHSWRTDNSTGGFVTWAPEAGRSNQPHIAIWRIVWVTQILWVGTSGASEVRQIDWKTPLSGTKWSGTNSTWPSGKGYESRKLALPVSNGAVTPQPQWRTWFSSIETQIEMNFQTAAANWWKDRHMWSSLCNDVVLSQMHQQLWLRLIRSIIGGQQPFPRAIKTSSRLRHVQLWLSQGLLMLHLPDQSFLESRLCVG
jgi:hypothetical protein